MDSATAVLAARPSWRPVLAEAGFATVAINAVGSGYGPQSNLVLTDTSGNNTTVSLGGRGIDLNGDGSIDSTEGCEILTPCPSVCAIAFARRSWI